MNDPASKAIVFQHSIAIALLGLLALQFISGATLALYYAPLAPVAFESIGQLSEEDPWVAFIARIHEVNTSFLISTALLHLCWTALSIPVRQMGRLNWIIGTLLLVLILGAAFTGSILPWTQDSLQALQITISAFGSFPVVGFFMARFLQGGAEIGTATLLRFFVFHAAWQPLLIVVLLVAHLLLWQRGPSRAAEYPARGLFAAGTLGFVLLAVLLTAAVVESPLEIEADARNLSYQPRPAWYFLPLFELSCFSGASAGLLTAGLFLLALLLPPLVLRRRLAGTLAIALSLIWMTTAVASRVWNPGTLNQRGQYSLEQLPLPGPDFAVSRRLFVEERCINCHALNDTGGKLGPVLTESRKEHSRQYFEEHIARPRSHQRFSQMPAYGNRLLQSEIEALVNYLFAIRSEE